MRIGVAYIATLVVLLILDFGWLGTVGAPLFKKTLGDVMAPTITVAPAVIFYLLYAAGIVYFAVLPGLDAGQWTTGLLRGALFGFFAYLTYDMTNLATLRNYTVGLALTDLAWGTIVTGVSAAAGTALTAFVLARFG